MILKRIKNISILSFDSPKTLNALTMEHSVNFRKHLENAAFQSKVIILTGEGSSFSSGGNLSWLQERAADDPVNNARIMNAFYKSFLKPLLECKVPTIAMINGVAVGAGACLTLACDFRIILSSAKMGFNFAKIGIPPGMGGSLLLPTLIGYQQAARLLLTGELIGGDEAARLGICLNSVSADQLLPKTMELASSIASSSPDAVAMTLLSLRQRFILPDLEQVLQREASDQAVAFSGSDFNEGLRSKLEKRKPEFKGGSGKL